jgi:DNA/RNA-binding domain of Phe-tRNA-synthetase-like protein
MIQPKREEARVFVVSERWKKEYPGAFAGVLVMSDVANPPVHGGLNEKKADLENELRSRFKDPAELRTLGVMVAYKDYYKRFKKTYHVLHQLESVVFKGKSIPRVSALVEAMFMAELDDMLLTAGHDPESVKAPVTLDAALGNEKFVKLSGEVQELKAGDMMMADKEGVISSVIYGPDQRTRITASTRKVMFTTYAPAGIGKEAVVKHLERIRDNVLVITPDAKVELIQAYGAE